MTDPTISRPMSLVKPEPDRQVSIYEQPSPGEVIAAATEQANALAQLIEQKKLYVDIRGRKFVKVEGWTTAAALNAVTARQLGDPEKLPTGMGWLGRAELVRLRDGAQLGFATGICGTPGDNQGPNSPWSAQPDYAQASMAVTRATGKACRLAFSWIMTLAGYEATPYEELPESARSGDPGASQPASEPRQENQANPFRVDAWYAENQAQIFKVRGQEVAVHQLDKRELVGKLEFAKSKGWSSWVDACKNEIRRRQRYHAWEQEDHGPEQQEVYAEESRSERAMRESAQDGPTEEIDDLYPEGA